MSVVVARSFLFVKTRAILGLHSEKTLVHRSFLIKKFDKA